MDADGDGFTDARCGGTDCDDANAAINPAATEVCDPEHVDEDCDPSTLAGAEGDRDADGFISDACCNMQPSGRLACGTDCDDQDAAIRPDAAELCDGIDNDCDGRVDEGVLLTIWPDLDNDSWGDAAATPALGCMVPSGSASRGGDCDDTRADVSPAGVEVCDGVDQDCDGAVDENTDALCDAMAPAGTIATCFTPAGQAPRCRTIGCEAGYYDCDGDGRCEDLCGSDATCDRCARPCMACVDGVCVGEYEQRHYSGHVADSLGRDIANASVTIVDACRSVGTMTNATGEISFGAVAFRTARVVAAGYLPELRHPVADRLNGTLRTTEEVSGWLASLDPALAQEADKGIIVVMGEVFGRAARVTIDTAAAAPFIATPGAVLPGDELGAGGIVVFVNVSPGRVRVRLDSGLAGCNFLCTGTLSAPRDVLVEAGSVTTLVYEGCGLVCA